MFQANHVLSRMFQANHVLSCVLPFLHNMCTYSDLFIVVTFYLYENSSPQVQSHLK